MSTPEWQFFFQSIFYPLSPTEVYSPQSCSHALETELKKTQHVAEFKNRTFSIKPSSFSVNLITKATTDAILINKSDPIREVMSYFLFFCTMLVCSLSWHVIPTSTKVTSHFLLSQINDSGLLICILILVPPAMTSPATIALLFSLVSCILDDILSVLFY